MAGSSLAYRVREAAGASGTRVIDLQGGLDASAGDAMDGAYAEAGAPGVYAILLNFSAIDYINSTGVALIIGLMMQASKAGRRLMAFGLSEHYERIFRVTRLVDYIGVFPDEPAALASLARPAA